MKSILIFIVSLILTAPAFGSTKKTCRWDNVNFGRWPKEGQLVFDFDFESRKVNELSILGCHRDSIVINSEQFYQYPDLGDVLWFKLNCKDSLYVLIYSSKDNQATLAVTAEEGPILENPLVMHCD